MFLRKNDFDDWDDFSLFPKQRNVMRTNLKEKDNAYFLEVELPGYKKEDINISFERGSIIIEAKKEYVKEEHNEKIIRQEMSYGSAERSFYLGEEVDEEKIKASYKNGILKIEVPKKEKRIENKKNIIRIED